MAHDLSDLLTLSRLLDEALDLESAQAEAWLAALAKEHSHLVAPLREMLAEHRSNDHAAFMSHGPRLEGDGADASGARAGDLVGPYRLIREIGHGGMGAVWLAVRSDGSLKRQIALKLPRLVWGADLAARMARERDIGALLEHPNIARLYDAGVDSLGRPYLALEYMDGQPLDTWCEARALTVRERLRLFLQVVRAVAYAHGRLVVHRDLKPSNIIVTADGQAHLLDFGIAKLLQEEAADDEGLTQQQGLMLTPRFASPEQLRGAAVTVASDVYSLGVLLYALLTRRHPYSPEDRGPAALQEAALADEPALASSRAQDRTTAAQLRGELDAILTRTLKRDPAQRYATANALAEDIERHLSGERVLAQPDSLSYRFVKSLKRYRVGFSAAGAVLLTVLAGAGVSIVQARRANDAADRARVIKEFVIDVFKVNERGNPANNELRQLPAELLLERGARLIDTRFPQQPQLQAELYGVVGGIFADMGANELAVTYAIRQIAALAATGASRAEQARAEMLLADSLFAQGRSADARLHAERALALAERDPALHPKSLVLSAQILRRLGQNETAIRMLDQAERELGGGDGPSAAGVRAKALRAAIHADRNDFDRALPLYAAAIDEAQAAEGPQSLVAIDIRLNVARNLVTLERVDESRPYRESALAALRAGGGPGKLRAALEESGSAAEMFEMAQIPFAQARDAIERNRASVAAQGELVPESIRAAIDFALGTILLDWGNISAAEPLLSGNVVALRARSEGLGERLELAGIQGSLAMVAGHHDEADALFRERLDLRQRSGRAQHPYAAYDYAFIAVNLVMQGRLEAAHGVLRTAPLIAAVAGSSGAPLAYRATLQSALARVELERGDAAAALALLPPADQDEDTLFPFDASLLRGEILCAVGRRAEGLKWLDKSLALHGAREYDGNPALARARAVTGLCALSAGDRTRARELARQAHHAFLLQPAVSNYFKAPLGQLERTLGESRPG